MHSQDQKHKPNDCELNQIEPVAYGVRLVDENVAFMCRQEEESKSELLRRGDQIE